MKSHKLEFYDLLEPIFPEKKLAILVAGVNYPRSSQAYQFSRKFRTYYDMCIRYKNYLLTRSIYKDKIGVLIFDFLNGVAVLYSSPKDTGTTIIGGERILESNYRFRNKTKNVYSIKNKGKSSSKLYYNGMHTFSLVNDVSLADYDDKRGQDPAQLDENSLSAEDIYKLIYTVQKKFQAKLIKELHFFGHAYRDGPIIVNTPGDNKKAFDKDCRINDFTMVPNKFKGLEKYFDSTNLPLFRSAFDDEPTLMIWGCQNNKKIKHTYVVAKAKLKNKQDASKELAEIKTENETTYAKALARTINKNVYAAFLGTYAVDDRQNNDSSNFNQMFNTKLMHVHMVDCGHIMRFYKDILGFKFPTGGINTGHPAFGRGYGIFSP